MPSAVLASRSRSAWVGYSETMLAAWLRANTNSPRTQTRPDDPVAAQGEPEQLAGAGEPSHRRAPSRVDCPLPAGVVTSSAW